MDVKTVFLNGVLKEEVYVEQPLENIKLGKKQNILKLKKTLYGLKQASRVRNMRIDGYFKENSFKQYMYKHAIYVKSRRRETLIVTFYVDDLIFMGNSSRMVEKFKGAMMKEFKMTDLRLMKYFLGLEVKQHEKNIFILTRSIYEEDSKKIQNGEL
jgi:Reverse transcriptase (RNA-dependent DNA polymerase)